VEVVEGAVGAAEGTSQWSREAFSIQRDAGSVAVRVMLKNFGWGWEGAVANIAATFWYRSWLRGAGRRSGTCSSALEKSERAGSCWIRSSGS